MKICTKTNKKIPFDYVYYTYRIISKIESVDKQ